MPNEASPESPPSDKYAPFRCMRCEREDRCLRGVLHFEYQGVKHIEAIGFVCQECRRDVLEFFLTKPPMRNATLADAES